jgi:DNA-binding LacI/PurR family transcriptional regulator
MVDRRKRVTSADVARAAGLSRATVSYVLNDAPDRAIPETTRRRVLEAAERLGYTPYAPARMLRSGRSEVVLLVLPDRPQGPVGHAMVEQMAAALAERGLTLVTHLSTERSPRGVWNAIAPAAVVGGMLFTPEQTADMRRAGVEVIVPSDEQAAQLRNGESSWSFRIGRLQAEHLLGQGLERLCYALPPDHRLRDIARQRLNGARKACREAGAAEPAVATVPLEPEAAARIVGGWWSEAEPPSGVCAFNDEVALAVLAGMREHGLRAPADLAVIGADDIAAARLAAPALTTITLDAGKIGSTVAAYVIAALSGDDPGRRPDAESLRVIRRASS